MMVRDDLLRGDPLSDVIRTLGPRSLRTTRFEGDGAWSYSFPRLDRLKFVAMVHGRQWITLPGRPSVLLEQGDVFLLGPTPYNVASDRALSPNDGMTLFADADVVRVGEAPDTVAIGGSIAFASSATGFLFEAIPTLLPIRNGTSSAAAVHRVLELLAAELASTRAGRALISTRLAEILVIEGLRSAMVEADHDVQGWLGALADPQIGVALRLMHEQVARRWTIAELASEVAMSRSAFSARFSERVGRPPLDYLRAWRMTAARAALQEGNRDMGILATRFGYASQAAFTFAFRRQFNETPRACAVSDNARGVV